MWNKDRQFPKYTLKVDGGVYGAYLTLEHVEEVRARLEKKGYTNIEIKEGMTAWPSPVEEKKKKNE